MFRKRLVLGFLSVLGLVILAAANRSAADQPATPEQVAAQKKEAKARKEAHERLNHFILAHRLIALGHDEEDTVEHPGRGPAAGCRVAGQGQSGTGCFDVRQWPDPAHGPEVTPASLVEEARKLGKDAPGHPGDGRDHSEDRQGEIEGSESPPVFVFRRSQGTGHL